MKSDTIWLNYHLNEEVSSHYVSFASKLDQTCWKHLHSYFNTHRSILIVVHAFCGQDKPPVQPVSSHMTLLPQEPHFQDITLLLCQQVTSKRPFSQWHLPTTNASGSLSLLAPSANLRYSPNSINKHSWKRRPDLCWHCLTSVHNSQVSKLEKLDILRLARNDRG